MRLYKLHDDRGIEWSSTHRLCANTEGHDENKRYKCTNTKNSSLEHLYKRFRIE